MVRTSASLTVGVLTTLALGSAATAARQERLPLEITVNVRSQTNAAPKTVFDARIDAARIYRDAGVEIGWTTSDSDLVIVLAGERDARLRNAATGTLGQALIDSHSKLGRVAFVYYDRVDELSESFGVEPGALLGYVIAHEIAHLLGVPHAASGLMRSVWDSGELSLAAEGRLFFSVGQREVLRRVIVSFAAEGGSGSSCSLC